MENNTQTKHPKGLMVLFFTEMWERFGFYLMLGIFVLYMNDSVENGGMGFTLAKSFDIYGTYIALVYLTPFIGGLLADRVLGYRLSINIGGLLMAAGYIGLAFPSEGVFYVSLLLIIVGNGFFKPNISTLLGNLYSAPEYKAKKDSGYSIFYMGINVGAFVCNFVAAYLRNSYTWGHAFAAAGIGMLIGLVWFWTGAKHYKEADVKKPKQKEDMSIQRILGVILLPAAIAGVIGWIIPGNMFGSDSTDAFILACVPVIGFYVSLYTRASKEDKAPIGALLSIFGVVVVFWMIFHQNGSALTAWADKYTHREFNESLVGPAKALGMVEEVDSEYKEYKKTGLHGEAILDANGKPIMEELPQPYLRNLPKEQWPEEGKSLKLISTELFQSVNPFFIILFTPLVVGFFGFLRRRNREPSTPAKIGWGLFITGLSTLVMVGAVLASDNGEIKSSAMWLVGTYAVVTIGELFLSPMGLSLVSKLSPPRITSLMMGGWFLSTAIGNKLSGVIAGLWTSIDNKVYFFLINFGGALLAAVAIFVMLKWLSRVVYETTGMK